MLYGYNRLGAFPQQQSHLISMGTEIVANSQGLILPFFVIEFKADGPGASRSLWVATNQCLGGSASCVNIAERLNRQLRQCDNQEIEPIDSAAFSIAMNGTEARLYISWKHNELDYYVRKVDSFLLQKDRDYIDFRKHMLNIIDWGKGKRLKQIRDSLDILVEENRKTASQQAKSRPPPTDDSANSKSYKRKNSRKGKTFDHSSDAIQDSQSSHYQSNEEDDPSSQLLTETRYYTSFSDQDGYNLPAQQPLSSDYAYNPPDVQRPMTSDCQYDPIAYYYCYSLYDE
ncbi:MAG: hypothetical protein FRX48_03162 [Lasallia pustulata]|uniref:DUF7924 domain-containing protein n=1 Tax=Lasallia pustulata TaxID=136370 RepID=A0A5M8PVJ2_9LECA|nr:MAG: hypothetical protein FRX48_03162 [Lasallia pustulata]